MEGEKWKDFDNIMEESDHDREWRKEIKNEKKTDRDGRKE